jgi:hypothetical protein
MGAVSDLEQRYRGPGRVQRAVALVVVAGLVLSGVGFLAWSVVFASNPEVTSRLTTFTVTGDHRAFATITVARDSEFTEATCRLEAVATDHSVVGVADVPVVDGPRTQGLKVEVRTSRRATGVQLLGCTAPGQQRPR